MPLDPLPPPLVPGTGPDEAAESMDFAFEAPARHGPPRFRRRPGRPPAAASPRRRWLDDLLGADDAADLRGILSAVHAHVDAAVRKSPPFTASLSLHIVGLMLLALFVVRASRERRPIELSFATATPVVADQPGVQLVEPQPEPEPEPEPEAMVEQEPVEEPVAAPQAVEAPVVEALGAAAGAAAAPAVGSLLDGREAGRKERLVAAYGGSDVTESAVARALDWLARQQGKDGLWSLQGPYMDGATQENRLAATAMALLAFQGAGHTPRTGLHQRTVATAWKALLKKQVTDDGRDGDVGGGRRAAGRFEIAPQDPPERQALYAHAQVTIALCEVYGMTKDPAYEEPARRALAYAVAAQGRNGGWRYEPGQDGDMSVTGWYMLALKSAEMAGLEVPVATFAGLGRFLDIAAVEEGRRYGYRAAEPAGPDAEADRRFVRTDAGPVTPAVSAEGLLCRQYLGWPRAHPALVAGVDVLLQERFIDWDHDKDVYAWYYITQVVHHLGGPAWGRWNERMKAVLPPAQVSRGAERGSWDPALDRWGPWGGRLFTTCFCTYMLEVYYRHLPLYRAAAVAAVPESP